MQIFWPEKPNGKSQMGEVRVKVKFTNALDEALLRRRQIRPDQVRTYEADALVDTGSVRTVVPTRLVEKLGVEIRGERVAENADGRKDTVGLTEPMIIDLLDRDTSDEALVLGDEVLIGQTVLE